MRLRRSSWLVVVFVLLSGLAALGQDNYKAEAASAPNSSALPKAVLDAIQPVGSRMLNDQGAPVAEIWLRKSIPASPSTQATADILYPGLAVGTFLGIIHYPQSGSDFRGQALKAGFYTLRYAQVPQDGNHMGVSSYRDFLVLAPVAADTQIDTPLGFEAMVKLGKQTSGTNHPAVLSLAAPANTGSTPSASRDDQGHWVIQVSAKTPSGQKDFAMGIVLVGKSEAA